MNAARRAQLLWHTIRFLRARQVASRLRLKTKALARRSWPDAARWSYERAAARLSLPTQRRWFGLPTHLDGSASAQLIAAATAAAEGALSGRFRFLDVDGVLGRPVAWDAAGMSQLWRYQLHYCGFLVDLAATRADAWPEVSAIMREWIESNPLGKSIDAWHPFVVSERIANWIVAIQISAPDSHDIDPVILRSLAVQSLFVDRNLETDVGGNHLLKNLKAMVIASCFWQGPTAAEWRAPYAAAFGRELCAQLLSDGAHYERSPMYHLLVLTDAVEVAAVLRASEQPAPSSLVDAVRAMVRYLPKMTHSDGEIALFNDSVFGEAPPPAAMEAFARRVLDDQAPAAQLTVRHAAMTASTARPLIVAQAPPCTRALEDGGLITLPIRGGRGVLITDVGRACPDELPAHAHADLFSFELSLGRERFVVDSGVGEYQAGPWREYYRSTRAHNTVAVDGADQIECWASFRVARRAVILDRDSVTGPLIAGVTAGHDGYARLADPVTVTRATVQLDDRAWLILDELDGAGRHTWQSFIHAAPDVAIQLTGASHAQLTSARQTLSVCWFGELTAQVVRGQSLPRQGWYAPAFGRHIAADVLEWQGGGQLPAVFGFVMAPDVSPADMHVKVESTGVLRVRLGKSEYLVRGRRSRLQVEKSAVA